MNNRIKPIILGGKSHFCDVITLKLYSQITTESVAFVPFAKKARLQSLGGLGWGWGIYKARVEETLLSFHTLRVQ